jgi:hypothetical protein
VGGKRHSDGIEVRHQKACRSNGNGGCCSRSPTYRAVVWSARDQRRLTKTFGTRAEAKAWRAEVQAGLRRGTFRASTVTLRAAAEAWVAGAAAGAIRNRSGDVYKPSVVRSYESALRLRVLPDLGARRLTDSASISPSRSAASAGSAAACDTSPTPSGATSTVKRRPSRCTFKVILPSRSFEPQQPEESLLRRTVQRPRPPGPLLRHVRSGLVGQMRTASCFATKLSCAASLSLATNTSYGGAVSVDLISSANA